MMGIKRNGSRPCATKGDGIPTGNVRVDPLFTARTKTSEREGDRNARSCTKAYRAMREPRAIEALLQP